MNLLIMLVSFGLNLGATAFAESGNLQITPSMIKFDYDQTEGGHALSCSAKIEDKLAQNWLVSCGSASDAHRYRVHLWLTRYERSVSPRQSYELLYWITDLSPMTPSDSTSSSTTIWFNFDKPSQFTQIEARLGVENDNAGLHLVIRPPRR